MAKLESPLDMVRCCGCLTFTGFPLHPRDFVSGFRNEVLDATVTSAATAVLLLSIDGRGVLQDEELNWQLRDMNYFISHGGLVDQSTLRKLKR